MRDSFSQESTLLALGVGGGIARFELDPQAGDYIQRPRNQLLDVNGRSHGIATLQLEKDGVVSVLLKERGGERGV